MGFNSWLKFNELITLKPTLSGPSLCLILKVDQMSQTVSQACTIYQFNLIFPIFDIPCRVSWDLCVSLPHNAEMEVLQGISELTN